LGTGTSSRRRPPGPSCSVRRRRPGRRTWTRRTPGRTSPRAPAPRTSPCGTAGTTRATSRSGPHAGRSPPPPSPACLSCPPAAAPRLSARVFVFLHGHKNSHSLVKNVHSSRGRRAYVAGLHVDADMAVLLEALALGEVGDDVAGHEDGDTDLRP
jgi:hypothetical protein